MSTQTLKKPTHLENQPWYKNYMVWMIILLPATVVVASLFTVMIAMQNAPQINDQTSTKSVTIVKQGKR